MAKLNITWPQFAVCNDNPTRAFEDMCRRLFTAEFLKGKKRPHANHNNAGIEVLPILEPERGDGKPQQLISFQCKYASQPSYAYTEFQKSAKTTVKEYKGGLDRVYLFCNKTLTTTADGYKAIEKIHDAAGIETVPISNDEVLDMVTDYPDIAEYFFQARIVADTTGLQPTMINGIPVYMVSADRIISDSEKPENEELLKELVTEKLTSCKNYALGLELESLKSEVEKLLSFGADDGRLYYFQLLGLLHAGNDTKEALSKCDTVDIAEAEWLINFYENPTPLQADEFKKHTPITQVFAIDKLFVPEHWRDLIVLYEEVGDSIDPSIRTQFDLHYGLSLLNLQENEKARAILHNLYTRTNERRMRFYEVCASIRIENGIYQAGMAGHHDKLAELVDELNTFKDLKHYSQQELFVAALKMESFYHLGIDDKTRLEGSIEEYEGYSEAIKANTLIRYYYALCLELNGNRDKAIEVYNSLDWKEDLAIAERFMICLILADQPKKAVDVYETLEQRAIRTEAVYLFALDRSADGRYLDKLQKAVAEHSDNLADFFEIAYFTDSEKPARNIVVPVLKKLLNEEALSDLLLYQKVEILTFLAHFREIVLMKTVLGTIEDISVINSFAIGEIYKALFDIANKEYAKEEKVFDVSDALEAAEEIADRFLEVNVSRKNFLQIKVLCSGAKKVPYSSLKYSKELFDITHDAEMARSVVALLFDRKETRQEEYAPYIQVLEKSENPDHCLVTACAKLVQGKESEAELYAYKALYFLNGEDNYQIYRSYFSFCNYNLHRYREDITVHSVRGGVVVMLEEDGGDKRFEICLDPESDFSDETNRSMGVEHLTPSNPDYIKLRGSGLGQVLRFRDNKYKIVQIMPRSQYGLAFIFRKIQEKPEMFRGVVWMISTDNIDEMIKQIKELTDNSEQVKSLLASYHFEQNEAGLPIDAVGFGDYSRYIAAFKYLLYQKNEAFYAGQPIYEDETGQKYVPGLATFVLLATIGRMDVLDAFQKDIVIPESYISFFQEEYSKAAGMDQVSTSTLFFVDDKPVMQEPDKTVPELWETILKFCQTCRTLAVSDQERIDFKIADGLTGERFISGLRLSVIHLDALLLAQREKATYLCDDLFFRKMATWMGVRNLNIVSLVQHYKDPDYMVPIIKELSKTNYVYIPLRARTDEEFVEICRNVLDGKKKEAFYSEIIQKFIEIRDRVLREYFGDEFVDKMYGEQSEAEIT